MFPFILALVFWVILLLLVPVFLHLTARANAHATHVETGGFKFIVAGESCIRVLDNSNPNHQHNYDGFCGWLEEKWGIWIRNPRIQNPICQGWGLLFTVAPDRLDDRVFARLYAASCRRWRDGKQYFDAIEREMARDRAKREHQYTQDTVDAAMPSFDHSKIQISMCGRSNGSKFADYHS